MGSVPGGRAARTSAPGLKFVTRRADHDLVTRGSTDLLAADESDKAIVGRLYQRVMEHIPAQFERQHGACSVCGRELPTVADGLLRLNGELECISCAVNGHHPPA
jgi:hypothetical protein